MTIRILITGGTIDDLEYDTPEKAPKGHSSLIPKALEQARVTAKYVIEELMAKDSRLVTDEDREVIARACANSPEDNIVITHGTMSLARTAKYLVAKSLPKTIVLVGSAIPLNSPNSDALFNLGAALTAVQLLPQGGGLRHHEWSRF